MSVAAVNGIEIGYEIIGDGSRTVILVPGAGCQMLEWHPDFCQMIADEDCRVVRIDNRDIGLSTNFGAEAPDPAALVARAMAGEPVTPPYELDDMADDTAALIAELSDGPAHVVGRSMGGMIGQRVAIRHPDAIASLCSVASTTGNPELPPATAEAIEQIRSPSPPDREGAIQRAVDTDRFFTGPNFEFDEEFGWKKRAEMMERCDDRNGQLRHSLTFMAGDPVERYSKHRQALVKLDLPVCVIHGSEDTLVNVAGGVETAELIPGAKLVVVEGMSHELPRGAWPQFVPAIIETIDRGQPRR